MPADSMLSALDANHDDFGPQAVDFLLKRAVDDGASDLHLLPTSTGLSVMTRIAGQLKQIEHVSAGGERIVARLKVLANLLTYRTDVPQEGRIGVDALSRNATSDTKTNVLCRDARLATCPTVHGEKAVLRFFPVVTGLETVADLRFDDQLTAEWSNLLSSQSGMLLVTGPAGSGKTTTAYAMIRTILKNSEHTRAIVSLEDPVEQVIDGIAQTSVGGTTGLTFADGLRAVLRHDPEIILIGELRDQDTIDTAIRASLTGHLVIATLHAGSAAEAVVRLFDAQVDLFLVLSGLIGVLNQRLLVTQDSERYPIAELLDLRNPTVRDGLAAHRSTAEVEALGVEAGMVRIADKARELVTKGFVEERQCAAQLGPQG